MSREVLCFMLTCLVTNLPLSCSYTVSDPPPKCLNNAGYAQCIQNISNIQDYVNCSSHVDIGSKILSCFYTCCENQYDCDDAMNYVVTNCNGLSSQNCSSSLQCTFERFVQGQGPTLTQYVIYLSIPVGTLIVVIVFFSCVRNEPVQGGGGGQIGSEYSRYIPRPMQYNYPFYYQPASQQARYHAFD